MSVRVQDLVLPVLAAGAIAAVIRARASGTEAAKGRRGRLRELAWCAALLVLSVMVMSTLYPLFERHNLSWWIVVPIAAALIIIFWPRLPARIVPVALILYGLFGFVVARDYASGAFNSYGLTPVGTPGLDANLILPQAYALMLAGGWLTLRSADPVLASARLWLGLARAPLGDQLRTMALLPVAVVLAGLLGPRWWLVGLSGLILAVALLFGVLLLIRRWQKRAAQLATAGLLCLGIVGLAIAAAWHISSQSGAQSVYAMPKMVKAAPNLRPLPAPSGPMASAARAKRRAGVVVVPAPSASAPSGSKRIVAPGFIRKLPARGFIGKPPAPGFIGKPPAPAFFGKPPAPGFFRKLAAPAFPGQPAAPAISSQAFPYGAVLVDSPLTADAAGVEGLALLALGTWLAPQTFPLVRRMLGGAPDNELTKRVERLTHTRAVAVDTASADLRRLERDLHDGAQARLVALGMSLRAAERLIPTSPEAALALVAEAREASVKALTELRELVRGVLPPVLADRGLADAVRALALDSPLHVETDIDLPGRLPAPLETACYFAVAELLTNAAKHSGARDARITMSHSGRLLQIEVTDFGLGGADPAKGSGLAGVERRLATFDGILAVSSPVGGPTMVVMEVPCVLSSLKTSSY